MSQKLLEMDRILIKESQISKEKQLFIFTSHNQYNTIELSDSTVSKSIKYIQIIILLPTYQKSYFWNDSPGIE